METLNILSLLLIAISNVYIGFMVRAQKTDNQVNVTVPEPQVTVEIKGECPPVTVHTTTVEIDYDRLAAAIRTDISPTLVPGSGIRVLPEPTWQNPVTSEAINTNEYDDGHVTLVSTSGVEVPVRVFPNRKY